ncbi:MAG: hypothetical protein KDB37_21260, partial [Ilumatobacter sp.]|nr:hypothetical protein [Ilumatobacter sp.]
VHRMRQRTERSLAAFCVARRGRKECNELAKILHGWDEEFSVLVRKRVARHIDHCDICERTRRKVVPLALFAGAPAFAAPVGLRDRVLAATGNVSPTASSGAGGSSSYAFGRPGGFPSALRHLHKVALILIGTAALVLLGAGGAVYVLADGSEGDAGPASTTTTEATSTSSSTPVVAAPPSESTTTTLAPTTSTSTSTTSSTTSTTTLAPTTTTVAPTTTTPAVADPPPATTTTTAPGVLRLSAGTVDLGHTSTSATITLSNPGGAPLGWTATAGPSTFRGVASPFAIAPAGGQLAPGASVEVTVSVDRAWPTEGAAARSFTFAAPGTAARLDVVATIGRAPALRVAAPPSRVCQKAQVSTVAWTAYATDESQPVDVTLTVVPPNGAAVESPMAPDAGAFFASFDLDRDRNGVPDLGVFAWTVTATDPHGFAKTSSGTVSVGQDRTHCP